MHENSPLLKAAKRDRLGTRYATRERAAGRLPAVLFGHGIAPLAISLDNKETVTHIAKGEKVFRLDIPGETKNGEQIVLLKDVQFDYLGTTLVHCDFARVDLNERIHTRVSIHLVGEARGLKTAGAVLMHPTSELEIECRVIDMPDYIEVSVADLDVDQFISAAQVKLPKDDMKLVTDAHSVVAVVQVQKEIVVAEATTVGTEAATPEVITAKKPGEGETAAAGAKDAKGGAGAGAAKPAAGGEKKEAKK
jgi:large subunit ribosomal protein L25